MFEHSYVIGIGGGSGSGKTTFIERVLQQIDTTAVIIFQHDWYYKDNSHIDLRERSSLNYDHPDALETSLLVKHLEEIIAGRPVNAPQYDFNKHLRKQETRFIEPKRIVFVDGILIFNDERLRNLMDLKIFVDTDADLRLSRRVERDVANRGRTRDSVIKQYLTTVKPMHDEFVEPSKQYADIIIPGGGSDDASIHHLSAKITTLLSPFPA